MTICHLTIWCIGDEFMSKVEQMVKWVRRAYREAAEDSGGYPAEVAVVRGHIVIAESVEDKPQLHVYEPAMIRRWHGGVSKYLRDHEDSSITEAVWECFPHVY
jgi:hypothetical protein